MMSVLFIVFVFCVYVWVGMHMYACKDEGQRLIAAVFLSGSPS